MRRVAGFSNVATAGHAKITTFGRDKLPDAETAGALAVVVRRQARELNGGGACA